MIALSSYYCCTVSGIYLISPEKQVPVEIIFVMMWLTWSLPRT